VNSQDPDDCGNIKQRLNSNSNVQNTVTETITADKQQNAKIKNGKSVNTNWVDGGPIRLHLYLIGVALHQFGAGIQSLACLSVLLPLQVKMAVGEREKGQALGVSLLAGSFLSLLLPPIIGIWSDYIQRRKPFMVVGMVLNLAGLIGMGFCHAIDELAGVNALVVIGSVTFQTAFVALLPDNFPKDTFGKLSGIMGALSVIGFLSGAGIGAILPYIGMVGTYCLIAGLTTICSLISYLLILEYIPTSVDTNVQTDVWGKFVSCFSIQSLFVKDFALVCFSRFFIQLGVFTVNAFLVWWVRDVIPVRGMYASSEVATLFIPVASTALISALVVGELSDRLRKRKVFVISSSIAMSSILLCAAFTTSFPLAVMLFSFFGLALGGFLALEFALVFEVLPNHQHLARDMGLFHVFIVLPQLFASPIAGVILDNANRYGAMHDMQHFGYVIVFCVTALYVVVGGLLLACTNIP
jgi:MFS family permease